MVAGVACSRGHHNDPRARFCASCGVSMAQSSVLVVDGLRPSLGVLVFADGTSVTLDRAVVVGREAERDPRVVSGAARALTLDDHSGHLSRLHAEVRLVGWDVHLVDQGSTNGTYVYDERRRAWHRLAPKHPHAVAPGASIAFGRHAAVFQSPLRPR
jgi:pSer/pThr/pTyr-binding forkhead associated (FHA) protein